MLSSRSHCLHRPEDLTNPMIMVIFEASNRIDSRRVVVSTYTSSGFLGGYYESALERLAVSSHIKGEWLACKTGQDITEHKRLYIKEETKPLQSF